MEAYMGMIIQMATGSDDLIKYGPNEFVPCDGRELSIKYENALFAILGNAFGGTYPNTFKLPDLRPKDSEGNVLKLEGGEIHNGVPYIPYFICTRGIFPTPNY